PVSIAFNLQLFWPSPPAPLPLRQARGALSDRSRLHPVPIAFNLQLLTQSTIIASAIKNLKSDYAPPEAGAFWHNRPTIAKNTATSRIPKEESSQFIRFAF